MPPLPKSFTRNKKILRTIVLVYCIASFLFLIGLVAPAINDYLLITRKNNKGITLVKSVRQAGLSDIENKSSNPAPPIETYQAAKKEIFISGLTLRNTLENYKRQLDTMMRTGIHLKLLLLDPNSTDTIAVDRINKRGENYRHDFLGVQSIIIKDSTFFHNPNLEIRFVNRIPSFVGVMIDGDVGHITKPDDSNGLVRVMPYLWSQDHDDWIFQFANTPSIKSAYTDYAMEFRYLWSVVARPHPDYFR